MKLNEADRILINSVLHVGDRAFELTKRHDAIAAACSHFARETNCNRTTTTVALALATKTFDPTSSVTGFVVDRFVSAEINFREVRLVPYQTVRRRFDGATPVGQPSMIGFKSDNYALFDVQTDAAYSLLLTTRTPLTTFISGTNQDPALNIPDEWAHDIIWWGGRSYLLRGASGDVDSEPAGKRFAEIIEMARKRFPSNQSGVADRNTAP